MPRLSIARSRRLAPIGALALVAALARSRRRIKSERRRLAMTIASLGDGVIVTEPGSTTIAAVNPRASELLPGLVPGRSVDSQDSPMPPLRSALESETTIEYRDRSLAVTAAPLGSLSDGVVWTVRDVTERVRRERTRSEFVATASHELRSPLTSIKGFVELLERSPEQMSERQRGFVEIILRSTDRLVDLVNDLLDLARIDSHQLETSHGPIDVGEAVHEVAELMGARIAEKRQELVVCVAPSLPLALADPGQVRQIIANLLTNAHQYTRAGGRIEIRVESERAWVRIIVADSGMGMTKEESGRVFERFYRGHQANAPGGTGLGLSIVKSLVDLHHGDIVVESEPGRGTTFSVRLPAALRGSESDRSLERSRVLVVARESMHSVLAPALDELGIEHRWERSGAAAARVSGERRFEVALVDVGIRNPQAVLQALELRGRRLRRAVILFSDGLAPPPPGIGGLGMEVVAVEDAPQALLEALRGKRED